ncbi:hypothetical protein Pmani_009160 [Petrolisthes manimaculis]|uniref:Uncharacterized protein n=1 Tax=Petrolisthes manimaculis TaxID=1843537 RepID=A0AAE1Q4X2_9EUCA|nr:hypothetical protein Pmani_009160 [Petrolisthes manimaculis]
MTRQWNERSLTDTHTSILTLLYWLCSEFVMKAHHIGTSSLTGITTLNGMSLISSHIVNTLNLGNEYTSLRKATDRMATEDKTPEGQLNTTFTTKEAA